MGVGPDLGFDRLSLPAMWKSGLRDAVEIMHVTVLASVKYSLLILISSSTTQLALYKWITFLTLEFSHL